MIPNETRYTPVSSNVENPLQRWSFRSLGQSVNVGFSRHGADDTKEGSAIFRSTWGDQGLPLNLGNWSLPLMMKSQENKHHKCGMALSLFAPGDLMLAV